jgi:hypothetical protein
MGEFLIIAVVGLMYRYAEVHSKDGIKWAIIIGLVWCVISFGFSFFLGWGPKHYFKHKMTANIYRYFFALIGAAAVFFYYHRAQKKSDNT